MRRFGFLNISFIFAGCFLGAGFLSGNELIQFFGNFGGIGILMLVLTTVGLCAFGFMIIYISVIRKATSAKDIVELGKGRVWGDIFSYLQCVPVFSISVIMSSGAGTIVYENLGISKAMACGFFCLLLFVATVIDSKFTALFFSLTIPLICVLCILLLVINILKGNDLILVKNAVPTDSLLKNPFLSALLYLSYSIFSSIGSIVRLTGKNYSFKKYFAAIILGGSILLIVALSVVFCIYTNTDILLEQLPMVSVSFKSGNFIGCMFSYFLLCGMMGAAINCQNSAYSTLLSNFKRKRSCKIALLLSVLTFLCSLLPFGDLVGTIYPIMGCFGVLILMIIACNFIKAIKTEPI